MSRAQLIESLRWKKFPITNDGFVCLVDLMGADEDVVAAARVSYGEGTRRVSDDRTLIRYLMRHRHCYHPDMQVLTAAGWKAWKDCSYTETFMVPDPKTRTLRPEKLSLEVFDADEAMQTFRSGRMSYCVTADHRMWFKGKYREEFEIVRASEMSHWGHFDPKAGYSLAGLRPMSEESSISPLGALVGFSLGDGSWSGGGLSFHLRKERKKTYLIKILALLGVSATESQSATYADASVFYIAAGVIRDLGLLEWMEMGERSCEKRLLKIPTDPLMINGLFDGLANSDGHLNEDRNDRIEFSSCSEQLVDSFETLASLVGYDAHRLKTQEDSIRVTAYPAGGRTSLEARDKYFGTERYCGKVYCTTTSNGLLMVRGAPDEFGFVCGNSTPLEMVELKFMVRVPMDCWRQWIRHRTASVNEYSTRYSLAIDSNQVTLPGDWRVQATTNRQGSEGYLEGLVYDLPPAPVLEPGDLDADEGTPACQYDKLYWLSYNYSQPGCRAGELVWFPLDEESKQRSRRTMKYLAQTGETVGEMFSKIEATAHRDARTTYEMRIAGGVAREQARKDLPLSTYTEAYWKIDLHNLLHFLHLRMDSHAQSEIRDYATAMGRQIVAPLFPLVWEAFEDYRLGAMVLTRLDLLVVNKIQELRQATGPLVSAEADEPYDVLRLAVEAIPELESWRAAKCRERDECHAKLVRMGIIQV